MLISVFGHGNLKILDGVLHKAVFSAHSGVYVMIIFLKSVAINNTVDWKTVSTSFLVWLQEQKFVRSTFFDISSCFSCATA